MCGIIKVPEHEVDQAKQAEGDGQQPAEAEQAADPELKKPAPTFPSLVSPGTI